MIPTLPWKAIGAVVGLLAILGLMIALINFGRKYERALAENAKLKDEIAEANAWKEDVLEKMAQKDVLIDEWKTMSDEGWAKFEELQAQPPRVVTRWREVAATVPDVVQLGDCDAAAIDAWIVLNQAGIAGVPP